MSLETRYELVDKVGTGSFATVYRARDTELGREVAIKEIHPQYRDDPEQLDRYWQEATLLASLQHPNIVTIYDVHKEKGWLILELMQASLSDRMTGKQMDLRALKATIAHGLRALKYLHSRGVIHGDVKPSNLMIDHRRRVKLGDFGIARRASDEEGSLLKGTTKYMAPEVVSEEFGDVGPASDLYSLGFAAYELMCGPNFDTLFPGLSAFGRNKQIAWMSWHAAADRKLPEISRVLSGVPEDLANVIQKLCEKDQSKRYKSADEALADLGVDNNTTAQSVPSTDSDVEAASVETSGPEDKKRLYIAAGGFALSLLLCVIMLWPSGSDPIPKGGAQQTVGFVREIDADNGMVVWTDVVKGVPQELKLGKVPELRLSDSGEYIRLAELKPGDRIQWRPVESGPVTELSVSRPASDDGRLISVDLTKQTVLISIEKSGSAVDVPFDVPDRAKIELNGETAQLSDLRPDDEVSLIHHSPLSKTTDRVIEKLEVKRTEQKVGHFEGYDPATRKLKASFGAGARRQAFSGEVAEDADIRLVDAAGGEGFPLSPGGIRGTDRLMVRYDSKVRSIEVHRADSRLLDGVIMSVDIGSQKIVVQASGESGKQMVFRVPAQTKLTLAHRTARLSDLRAYDNVNIMFDLPADLDTAIDEDSGLPLRSAIVLDSFRGYRYDREMVLVGTEAYRFGTVSPLPYARDSANAIGETFTTRYSTAPERVHRVFDPTAETFRTEVSRKLKGVSKNVQLIVYVCCQAYEASDGQPYLACIDTNPTDLARSAVPLEWLIAEMEKCPSDDKVLLLDIAHKQTIEFPPKQSSAANMARSLSSMLRTVKVIASGTDQQKNAPDPNSSTGLFATAVQQGFSGTADSNRDLKVSAKELWSFLGLELSQRPLPDGRLLTPVLLPASN